MHSSSIRWTRVIAAVLLAEIILVAAAFGWVAIYSHVIDPGQPMSVYHAHAMRAGPWVSIIVGIPLFFALGRWLARHTATALVIGIGYAVLDGAILWAMSTDATSIAPWQVVVSFTTKIAAAYLGVPRRVSTPLP
jgi:hypothetical protein